MKKLIVSLRYRYAMATAYLMQEYAPMHAQWWLQEADKLRMQMWKIERGMMV